MAALLDIVKKGSTDRSVTVRIIDATAGTPETGVVFDTSGIDLWYRREGETVTSITEADLTTPALDDAHADGGFLHISDGEYRLDLPDAAFATGANYVDVGGTVTGMVVIGGRVRLVDYDPEDAAALGLTNLDDQITDAVAAPQAAIVANKLDHLVAVAESDDPADNSIIAKLAASDGDWSGFSAATDALEAIRDRGDAAWVTGAGGSSPLQVLSGTIGSTGNSTTALHLDGLTFGDGEIADLLLAITDESESETHVRWIESWTLSSELAVVATLPFTPEDATDTYVLLAIRRDVDLAKLGGDAQSLADLKDFADAGYDPSVNKVEGVKLVDATTTNTDMRGTDSAALASVLGAAVGADISADIAANLAAIAALEDLSAAEVNAEVDQALADYDGPTRTEATADKDEILAILGTPIDTDLATDIANNLAAIAALEDLSAAEVDAEIDEALATTTYAEPTGVPPATAALAEKIGRLYMEMRNQVTATATKKTVFDDGGSGEYEYDLSDDGTAASKSEANAL